MSTIRITQEIRQEVLDYRCPICKKAFDRLPDFKQHVGLRKMANGKFKQQLCNANTQYTLAEWGSAIDSILSTRADTDGGERGGTGEGVSPNVGQGMPPARRPTAAPTAGAAAGPSGSGQRRIEVQALPRALPAKNPRAEALTEYRRQLRMGGFDVGTTESDAQEEKDYLEKALPFLEQERAVVEASHAQLLRRLGASGLDFSPRSN